MKKNRQKKASAIPLHNPQQPPEVYLKAIRKIAELAGGDAEKLSGDEISVIRALVRHATPFYSQTMATIKSVLDGKWGMEDLQNIIDLVVSESSTEDEDSISSKGTATSNKENHEHGKANVGIPRVPDSTTPRTKQQDGPSFHVNATQSITWKKTRSVLGRMDAFHVNRKFPHEMTIGHAFHQSMRSNSQQNPVLCAQKDMSSLTQKIDGIHSPVGGLFEEDDEEWMCYTLGLALLQEGIPVYGSSDEYGNDTNGVVIHVLSRDDKVVQNARPKGSGNAAFFANVPPGSAAKIVLSILLIGLPDGRHSFIPFWQRDKNGRFRGLMPWVGEIRYVALVDKQGRTVVENVPWISTEVFQPHSDYAKTIPPSADVFSVGQFLYTVLSQLGDSYARHSKPHDETSSPVDFSPPGFVLSKLTTLRDMLEEESMLAMQEATAANKKRNDSTSAVISTTEFSSSTQVKSHYYRRRHARHNAATDDLTKITVAGRNGRDDDATGVARRAKTSQNRRTKYHT